MSDAVAVDQRRSPFAGVPTREIVRDAVAVGALLVALPLPWAMLLRGSDLLWVVLATVAALVVIVAPYAERAGVLSEGWKRLAEPATRWWGLAPYGLVALLYLVLDVVSPGDQEGFVGGGLAVGLAGAVLAAAMTGTRPMVVSALVLAAGAVLNPLLNLVGDTSANGVLGALLGAVLVLGLLWATVRRFLRGDDAAGIVLLVVGGAVMLEIVMLGGGVGTAWFDSVHGSRFGLLLLPVVSAAAAVPVLTRIDALADEPVEAASARWVRVAVQSFELMTLVAGFVAAVALVRLVGVGVSAEVIVRLIVGVLVVVVAVLARRALLRNPKDGHATAVGAACVVVVLGVIIVVARAGVGTASRVEELLLALALPALVLVALIVPPSVRALLGSEPAAAPVHGQAEHGQYSQPEYGQYAGPDHDQPEYGQYAQPDYGQYAGPDHDQPEYGQYAQPEYGQYAQPEHAQQWSGEESGHSASSAVSRKPSSGSEPGARWRGTWADGTDATQHMSPVRSAPSGEQPQAAGSSSPVDATAVQQPVRAQAEATRAESTQMMSPVADAPAGSWTAEQAMDPHTPLEQLAQIVQEAPHLRPHVAANPATYPALLDWLGALGDPAVDAALRSRR
ncbi:hypothetical protein [Isoptericola sediminis]|uniref:Uncharacterized protein n=1 Tax=Isoptericola sediminis TaxID=2733572 RepID=A0A849KID5_9MICO|nr:hypothetical protein [Isoptericola sediminis]NNU28413.1 hypothetical protein [Isoptericola sediminis]